MSKSITIKDETIGRYYNTNLSMKLLRDVSTGFYNNMFYTNKEVPAARTF